jgi:hypothetical protein
MGRAACGQVEPIRSELEQEYQTILCETENWREDEKWRENEHNKD